MSLRDELAAVLARHLDGYTAAEYAQLVDEEIRPVVEAWRAAKAANDVRGAARMSNDPPSSWPSFAELERRRQEVTVIPPGRDWPRGPDGQVL